MIPRGRDDEWSRSIGGGERLRGPDRVSRTAAAEQGKPACRVWVTPSAVIGATQEPPAKIWDIENGDGVTVVDDLLTCNPSQERQIKDIVEKGIAGQTLCP